MDTVAGEPTTSNREIYKRYDDFPDGKIVEFTKREWDDYIQRIYDDYRSMPGELEAIARSAEALLKRFRESKARDHSAHTVSLGSAESR